MEESDGSESVVKPSISSSPASSQHLESSGESSTSLSTSISKPKAVKNIPLSPEYDATGDHNLSQCSDASYRSSESISVIPSDPRVSSGTYRTSHDVIFKLCKYPQSSRDIRHRPENHRGIKKKSGKRKDSKSSHGRSRLHSGSSKHTSSTNVSQSNNCSSTKLADRNSSLSRHSSQSRVKTSRCSKSKPSATQSSSKMESNKPSLEDLEQMAHTLRNALQDDGNCADASDNSGSVSDSNMCSPAMEMPTQDKVKAWVDSQPDILSPVKTPKKSSPGFREETRDPRLATTSDCDKTSLGEVRNWRNSCRNSCAKTEDTRNLSELNSTGSLLSIKSEPMDICEITVKKETFCHESLPPPLPPLPNNGHPPPLPPTTSTTESDEVIFIKSEPLDNMEIDIPVVNATSNTSLNGIVLSSSTSETVSVSLQCSSTMSPAITTPSQVGQHPPQFPQPLVTKNNPAPPQPPLPPQLPGFPGNLSYFPRFQNNGATAFSHMLLNQQSATQNQPQLMSHVPTSQFNLNGWNSNGNHFGAPFLQSVPSNVNSHQLLPQFVPQHLPQTPLDLNQCQPLAQMNSTIVVNPNSLSTPFTFNANLTSFIPYCQVPQKSATSQQQSQMPHHVQTSLSQPVQTASPHVNSHPSVPGSNENPRKNDRYNSTDRNPQRDRSSSRNDDHNKDSNTSNRKRMSSSPKRVNCSSDFPKHFTYETFLVTGIEGKKTSSFRECSTKRESDDSNAFDLVELRSEVNQFGWSTPGATSSQLRRIRITSTPAFRYYIPSDSGLSLVNCGVTESMRELQSAFTCFITRLSRHSMCHVSSSRNHDLNSIINQLSNHMLRLGADMPEKKAANNRKTVAAMLKQLKINITEIEEDNAAGGLSSNIDRLLSPENNETLPGEAYHSKASRSRKRTKNHRVEISKMSKAVLKNRIDDFIEKTSVDDDLIAEKLKMEYVSLQKSDPSRLHKDIYPNEKDFLCHKPACTCLGDNKQSGPHHGFFYGEYSYEKCDPFKNNLGELHHYSIRMAPIHHFELENPTVIKYENVDYEFGGFSLFSHEPLVNIPAARFTKGNTHYTLELVKEPPPSSFSIKDCDMLSDFLFETILEFFDFDIKDPMGCRKFHILPRFERSVADSGVEILSAHAVIKHIISSFAPLFDKQKCEDLGILSSGQLSNVAASLKDHVVYFPGKKPMCVRVDDVSFPDPTRKKVPSIVHTTLLPSALSFLGDKKFLNLKKLHAKIRETMQFRNDPKDAEILSELEKMMEDHKKTKRATVFCELSAEDCYFSGFKCDITHCAVYIPRIIFHIRRHLGLQKLCRKFDYSIKNPLHFEVAFTHSTGPENVLDGTNKSHVKNSRYRVGKNMNDVPINERSNNGSRVKASKHKRNLFTMIQTMQKLPSLENDVVDYPTTDNYERIEFLGDAVLEMIVSTHLFFMLPDAKEGILSLFRIPLVANTYLSKISKRAGLNKHLIISHDAYFNLPGPRDKIHADILEAFLGAIFLDSGLTEADRIFARMFFTSQADRELWQNLKPHEFQQEYPSGDRHLIEGNVVLQKLTQLEESLGLKFNHIQLLARALTSSALSYNFLTCGSNERLEFLGDTVMKLLVTNFIYKHFPVYHENHLSTLRGTLVSRFTQEEVSRELGLTDYTIDKLCVDLTSHSVGMTTKRKADLFEAFLAAVFVDQGLETCMIIFRTCIFPKIPKLLTNQRWLTPHMMLHCCLLAIRSVGDFESSMVLIPSYRVLQNNRDQQGCISTNNEGKRNGKQGGGGGEKYVGVFIGGRMIGSGHGKSLPHAASQACRDALALFQAKHPQTLVSMLSNRVDSIVNSSISTTSTSDCSSTSLDTNSNKQSTGSGQTVSGYSAEKNHNSRSHHENGQNPAEVASTSSNALYKVFSAY